MASPPPISPPPSAPPGGATSSSAPLLYPPPHRLLSERVVKILAVTVLSVLLGGTLLFLAIAPDLTVTCACPGSPPLGSEFAWGNASNVSVPASGAAPPGCIAGDECYRLGISNASGGLTAGSLAFAARDPSGAALELASGGTIQLFPASGSGAALASYSIAGSTWTSGSDVQLAAEETMVYCTHTSIGSGSSLGGDTIVAVGSGSVSGTVASGSLPA
jgi:hypothetical protein